MIKNLKTHTQAAVVVVIVADLAPWAVVVA